MEELPEALERLPEGGRIAVSLLPAEAIPAVGHWWSFAFVWGRPHCVQALRFALAYRRLMRHWPWRDLALARSGKPFPGIGAVMDRLTELDLVVVEATPGTRCPSLTLMRRADAAGRTVLTRAAMQPVLTPPLLSPAEIPILTDGLPYVFFGAGQGAQILARAVAEATVPPPAAQVVPDGLEGSPPAWNGAPVIGFRAFSATYPPRTLVVLTTRHRAANALQLAEAGFTNLADGLFLATPLALAARASSL